MNEVDLASLVDAARRARAHAHAPYSRFLVGAVVRARDGSLHPGCNVENGSYGLTNCAERTALFSAVAAGHRPGGFTHLVVIGDTPAPIAPCGACRQVMLELGGRELRVVRANLAGAMIECTAADLLPGAFELDPAP